LNVNTIFGHMGRHDAHAVVLYTLCKQYIMN